MLSDFYLLPYLGIYSEGGDRSNFSQKEQLELAQGRDAML
jgi:hypothetical protein